MNVYDTANKLAIEIKESEEYKIFREIKEQINGQQELNDKIKEFEKLRYEVQMFMMQNGKVDEEKYKKVENMYSELLKDDDVKKYFEAETKFNILIADINKIIGEAIREIIK